jgi:hypothetical protein
MFEQSTTATDDPDRPDCDPAGHRARQAPSPTSAALPVAPASTMYLHALATALPPTVLTQAECWDIVQRSEVRQRLNRRSVLTLQAILRHDSGISTRHFAMPDINRVFSLTPDELNEAFRVEAPRLASRARAGCRRRGAVVGRRTHALWRPADLAPHRPRRWTRCAQCD